MWGKNNERDVKPGATPPQAQPAYQPPPERTPAAIAQTTQSHAHPAPPSAGAALGKNTKLRGEIYSDEELFLDGEVEGTLHVQSRLTIGPNGKVKANVKAREVVVRGSVQGNVEAADRIAIMNGASIVGDVKTAGIVIEDGAYFKGGIDIIRPESVKKSSGHAPSGNGHAAGNSQPSNQPVKAQTATTR